MSLEKTLQEIKKGEIHPVYLLYGTENFFVEQFKNRLKASVKEETGDEITTFDLMEIPVEDVITDAETIPFFNERKLIFAFNPVFLKSKQDKLPIDHNIEKLIQYLQNPAPYSILVIHAPYEKIDERKKISKTLKKYAMIVNCNPIKEKELRKWIVYMAKRQKIKLTEEALFLLESEFSNNLYILKQEIEKLAIFAGNEGEVTKEMAAELLSASISFTALELVDAVLKKDIRSAIKIYKDLEKQKEDPIGLIAFLAYQFRIIFQVKLFEQRGYSNQQMQKEIKVHPFVIKLALMRSKFFSIEKLGDIIFELTDTDTLIKQGKIDKGIAFEMLLYKIIQP